MEAMKDLVESFPYHELRRCFPVENAEKKSIMASNENILDAIVEGYRVDTACHRVLCSLDNKNIAELIKAGILTDQVRFTSPFAQNFYYCLIFPRAPLSVEPPATLDKLIEQVTRKLSARRLRVARQQNIKNGEFRNPKEAVFQQLFHEAIASLLPVTHRIIPELGTNAVIDGKSVGGALDFYINNGNKWALELRVEGRSLREHHNRIPGKYRNVQADSWLVVDCRSAKSKARDPESNLCILNFDEDYKSCKCQMRMEDETIIELAV